MILIPDDLKEGDMVVGWMSPYKEKANKKMDEFEYKIGRYIPNKSLELVSVGGDYKVIYDKSLIETWNGVLKKVKVKGTK